MFLFRIFSNRKTLKILDSHLVALFPIVSLRFSNPHETVHKTGIVAQESDKCLCSGFCSNRTGLERSLFPIGGYVHDCNFKIYSSLKQALWHRNLISVCVQDLQ